MAPIFNRAEALAPLLLSETRAKTAKATLHKNETAPFVTQLGGCIEDVRLDAKLTLDEFAHALKRDPSQVSRWIRGEERPQLETVLAVERFRAPLLIALASLSPDIVVETTLTYRRTA